MKRIIFLLPLALLFYGCPSDDDATTEVTIVGKWKFDTYEYFENGELVESGDHEHFADCPNYIEFFADGTYSAFYYYEGCDDLDAESTGSYTYSNNTITFVYDGETETLPVVNLTENQLVIEDAYTENGINYRDLDYLVRID